MLIFGGIQSLSSELRSGRRWCEHLAVFAHITFPLLSPTTFFLAVTSFITMFQNFETVCVLRKRAAGEQHQR